MTDTVVKTADELLELMRGRGVTVLTKADVQKAPRQFSKEMPHVAGECEHCHKDSKHLDAHVSSCILNPLRKNRKGMKVCRKCKLKFHIATHKCDGDMASVITHHLADLRSEYRSAIGAPRAHGGRNGVAKTEFPKWFIDRNMELWRERGMPKSWKFDSNMMLVRPSYVKAPAKVAEKPVVQEVPVVEQTTYDLESMKSVDLAEILFAIIGKDNVAGKLGTIMQWMDLTKELID